MEKDFDPDPKSVRTVRRFVAEALPGQAHLEDIVLAASELATNVVRHARTPFTVRLHVNHALVRLEMSDGSSILPAVEELSESSRGLRLVEAVSEDWGVELTKNGKTVWVEFRSTGA